MYPKPPKHYYPKDGDVVEPRNCDYCGHSLEEYRGVLEIKPDSANKERGSEVKDAQDNQTDVQKAKSHEVKNQDNKKPSDIESADNSEEEKREVDAWFFCNYEHQASFHENRNRVEAEETIEADA